MGTLPHSLREDIQHFSQSLAESGKHYRRKRVQGTECWNM